MKQVIIFRSDLKLGKGKLAAHAGHAALEGYLAVSKKNPRAVEKWLEEGQKKIVLKVLGEKELLFLYDKVKRELPSVVIRDAGLTQIEPGTITCLVIGPGEDATVDRYIKDLKLL
jgi:PTH2 family peptidyl-tRNA hydrolase